MIKIRSTTSIAVCALALLLPCVVTQGLRWSQVPTDEANRPSPRSGFAFGYDPVSDQLIVFSGFGASNDTWLFDLATGNWSEVQVTQPAPPPRAFSYYGVVLVSGESLFVVMLGLLNAQGVVEFDDVWVFSFANREWSEIQPEGSGPSFRYGGHFGAAYGGSNTLWVGSGFTETTKPLQTRYSDIYKLIFTSPTAASWEEVYAQPSPGNQFMPLSPHGRCLQASAVIAGGGLVLAGGCMRGGRAGGPCPTDDTWFFNENRSSWEELNRCITPRAFGGMAAISNNAGKAVLYGGNDQFSKQLLHVAEAPYPESEVFVVDVLAGGWKRYRTEADSNIYPMRRFQFGMASGPDGAIYMFGGVSGSGRLNDLWVLSGDVSQTDEIECNNVWFSYAHLHGLLMFLAFGFLFPIGVIVVQLFRCKKSKAWFVIHVILQITAVLLAIIAFIMIFSVSERAGQTPTHPHAIIGIFLMFFMFLQPINGIFRPHIKKDGERSTYRICWEWFHRLYGAFVIILGFVQVTLGMFLVVPPMGVWVAWIVILGMWCLHFIISNVTRIVCHNCPCCTVDDGVYEEKHELK